MIGMTYAGVPLYRIFCQVSRKIDMSVVVYICICGGLHDRNDLCRCSLIYRIFCQVLYEWYFLHAFNFRYFHAPHDSAKMTSFK